MPAVPIVPKKAVPMLRNPLVSHGGKKERAAPVRAWLPARSGAVVARYFPSSPEENFSHKVNRKMYRAGIGAILSQLVRENRLSIVESFTVDTPKTKALAAKAEGDAIE